MSKLNYDILVRDFNITHDNKYKYPKFIYASLYEKITIMCPDHGEFSQQIMAHRQGGKCKLCANLNRSKNMKVGSIDRRTEKFKIEVESKFGDKFDLSKVKYSTTNDLITIGCPNHGEVNVAAGQFKRSKFGCPYCGGTKKLTQEMFLNLIPESHKAEYDLSNTIYKTRQDYITVGCRAHGNFSIRADNFIIGQGCPKCRYIKSAKAIRGNIEDILESFKITHNNKYTYEEIEPFKSRIKTKIKIICPDHGPFIQPIDRHYTGHGCPTCKSSKGELAIIKILEEFNIDYINEYSFKDLKKEGSSKPLRFDFYLPKYNVCIEYDGRHHFEEIETREKLEETLHRDNLKTNYCTNRNIGLLRLNYMMDNYGENELVNFLKALGIE